MKQSGTQKIPRMSLTLAVFAKRLSAPKSAQQESAQRLNHEQTNDNNPAPPITFRCGARETNLDLSATGGNTTYMESKGSEYFDLLITSLNLYSIKSPTAIKVPGLFYLVEAG